MATNEELLEKLDKIDDEELAHMLALVAYRESQEELDQLIQSEEYTPPDEIQMRAFQEKFHKDSQRALHRSKSRVIRWVCGIAAAAVFAFAVPISADNVTIFELIAQVLTDHSDISTLDGYTFEKPAEWNCEYYPTWIPSSFSFSEIITSQNTYSMKFQSSDKKEFTFSYTIHWSFNYSSIEKSQFSILTMNINGEDFPFYSSINGTQKTLYLKTEEGTIVIEGNLTQQELQEIVKNIYNFN